ncbi:MAG TPA: pyridoxal phosphate-dependent aminotransferase [Candidatus Polarisedimenticolaceae bacterium]|nr:pyridoxal phosphate-dependent aminotransferase [Candidatus Polarisedimenticolaceae bacterium]
MSLPNPKRFSGPASFIGHHDKGIISFGSGQPDLPPPPNIFENLETPQVFQYGLIQGEPKLRFKLQTEYAGTDPDNFIITNGASEALDLTFRAIRQLHGNVKVLVCRPYYYSYPPLIELAGLTPVYTDLTDGRIDLADFKAKLPEVKAILINSPSNPTGRIEDMQTLAEIEALANKQGMYVISDEVYKDLIYTRENYFIQGEHVITINSFSKTYAMCGIRVGYLHTPDQQLIKTVLEMKTHTSMNTSIIGQQMALQALNAPTGYVAHQTAIWKKRRDLIYKGLVELGFDLWKPEGAFYVFPRVKNATQVVSDLFYDHQVIVYDGGWFGAPDRIRLSYALDTTQIKEGLERMGEYFKDKPEWLA